MKVLGTGDLTEEARRHGTRLLRQRAREDRRPPAAASTALKEPKDPRKKKSKAKKPVAEEPETETAEADAPVAEAEAESRSSAEEE